jgi:hypothetical protein
VTPTTADEAIRVGNEWGSDPEIFALDKSSSQIEVGQFVRAVQTRQGHLIGSPDEAAWRMGFISSEELKVLVMNMNGSEYKGQLTKLISH